MSTVVARIAHQIPDRRPLRLRAGDAVDAGDRDTQWPEFVFVSGRGGTGWVPARQLSADSGRAVVLEPYDTTELPTSAGDLLDVLQEDLRSGWLWCRAANGREGWVPVNTVEVTSGPS